MVEYLKKKRPFRQFFLADAREEETFCSCFDLAKNIS